MATYDVIPFFNELDLLSLRLNTLDPYVDYFVVSEATTTHAGNKKELILKENLPRFEKFRHKMIHNVVEADIPGTPHEREWFQFNSLKAVLEEICESKDVIIWSDVDEIPNPEKIAIAQEIASSTSMAHFAQRLYYYYLNLEEVSGRLLSYTGEYPDIKEKKWLGSRAMSFEYMRDYTMVELRHPKHKQSGVRIPDGGWHFSFCGSRNSTDSVEHRIREKLNAYGHYEMVNEKLLKKLGKRLEKNRDLFGRRGAKFEVVPIDDRFPSHLVKNSDAFRHLIMPTPGEAGL